MENKFYEPGLISRMEQLLTDAELGLPHCYDIYCGSDTRAEFLADAMATVGLHCELYTIDGEYWAEVYRRGN